MFCFAVQRLLLLTLAPFPIGAPNLKFQNNLLVCFFMETRKPMETPHKPKENIQTQDPSAAVNGAKH